MSTLSITRPDSEAARMPSINWAAIAVLLSLLALFGSIGGAYYSNDKAIAERVSVVETKQDSTEKRLDRIEAKLDVLLSRVK